MGGLNDPDLTVAEFNAPDSVVAGQAFEVSYKVTNLGPGAAKWAWVDRVYYSADSAYSEDDRELGMSPHFVLSMPAGGYYRNTMAVTVPGGIPAGPVMTANETVQVSWTVANTGTETASAPWEDAGFLSSDDTLDPGSGDGSPFVAD